MADSDDEDRPEDRQLKIVLLGNGTAGKTSIITRFSQNHFGRAYQQTIGLDFFMKRITIPGGINVTLQVWDIGGQQIGGRMLDNYIYGAHVVLFVYDITNYASFDDITDWMEAVESVTSKDRSRTPHLALVGNKIDLEHQRVIRKDRHTKFCKENKMSSHFVSAKTDDLINSMFLRVTCEALGVKLSHHELEKTSTVVKADIVQYRADKPVDQEVKRTRSSFCSIQ